MLIEENWTRGYNPPISDVIGPLWSGLSAPPCLRGESFVRICGMLARRGRAGAAVCSRSGQVMVEVCLAMALLAFAWIAVTFATYMSTNHIRTAMAARHAAWIKGSGEDPAVELIESNFFFQGGVTEVETGHGMGIADLIAGNADCAEFGEAADGPYVAKVTFGILPEDINATTTFPFTLMKVQVPLMPPSLMEDFLSVESQCQWDEVGDSWTDRGKALEGALNTFKSEIGGVISEWFDL